MYCYTQCPQPCSRPASTQASSRDSWTHRQVWDSLSWGHCSFLLGHGVYKFLLCPPRVYFPVCCKFWQFYGGLIVTSSKRLLPFPSLWHPEPLSVWQTTANLYLHRRHSNTALSQSLWGPWVLVCTKFAWALWASLVGMGFYFKHEFALLTVLLRLLLCPWTWGISSPQLQYLLSYWGFSHLGHGVSPHSQSSEAQLLLLPLDMGYLFTAVPAKHSHHS